MASSSLQQRALASVQRRRRAQEIVPTRGAAGFWRRLLRQWSARISFSVLLGVVILALFAPLLAPYEPNEPNFLVIRQSPSADHVFGTDAVGRDVLSRVIYGSRVSLAVAVVAVMISASVGVLVGSLSGFFGGWLDAVLQRITEVFMAFPTLLLIITIATIFAPSLRNAMLIIGLLGWVSLSRLMRAEILGLKERDFVVAARTAGATTSRLIFRHLLPNASGPLIVNTVFGLRAAILAEAALSFIGAGVPQPTASWGNMINVATSITHLEGMAWAWVPPTCMLVITVVAFSFAGDAVARASRE